MKKILSALIICLMLALIPVTTRAQAAKQATIEPETKARIILQTRLSSKLSEPGDPITAVLDEPIYVGDELVMPRGTEFKGRVAQVTHAGRPLKSGTISIIFERVAMPWGDEPVSIALAAIDDWDKNEKLKANDEGKVKGDKRGDKAAENVIRGGSIGGAGAGVIILTSRSAGALPVGGAALGAGMLAGLLLTKGGEIQVNPGAVMRIKFLKPMTLPVIQQSNASPRPIQQDEPTKPPILNKNL
ncbi:MAG TPA: hypothetical protein VNN73_12560 [Blastocatellia bacterium]|nr:hypothetical protein [Blastocatellia bacterium]